MQKIPKNLRNLRALQKQIPTKQSPKSPKNQRTKTKTNPQNPQNLRNLRAKNQKSHQAKIPKNLRAPKNRVRLATIVHPARRASTPIPMNPHAPPLTIIELFQYFVENLCYALIMPQYLRRQKRKN